MRLDISILAWGVCVAGFCGMLRADEPVTLRYQLNKGDKLPYRLRNEIKQTLAVGNLKIENLNIQEAVTSRTVGDKDEKGNVQINVKNEQFKLTGKYTQGGEFKYDSTSTERDRGSEVAAVLGPVCERLTGLEMQLLTDARGTIFEVKGYAEGLADVIKDNPFRALFVSGGTNAVAKLAAQEVFPVLASNPVKTGERWEVPFDTELPSIGKAHGKLVFTYAGPEKFKDQPAEKISVTTDMTLALDTGVEDAKLTGTLSTSQSAGTVYLDNAKGRLLSLKNSYTISGQISITANNVSTTLQDEQTHTTTAELLDKLP